MKKNNLMINRNNLIEGDRDINIPIYADDKIQNKIKDNELKKQKKMKEEERLKEKAEKKLKKEEYKKTLIPLKEINVILKLLLSVLIAVTTFALIKLNFIQGLYGVISIYLTVFVGKRARLKNGELTEVDNALLWNFSEFINQILDYKTVYDVKSSYISLFNKASYLLIGSVILLTSSGIIYIFALMVFIVTLLICIGVKDFEPIINNQPMIMGCALIGLIIKFVFALFICQSISIDCFNILIILGLGYLDILKHFNIQKP